MAADEDIYLAGDMNQKMEWSIDRSVVRSNRRTRRERGRGARARRERGAARVRRATLAVESAGAPRTTDASVEEGRGIGTMRGGVSGRSRGRRTVARGDPRRSGASFARWRRKNSRAHSGARDRAPRRARELSRAPSAATRSRTARPRIEPRGTAAIARVGPRPEDVVRHSIVELGRTAYFTLSRANGMERRRFVRGRAPPERRRERRGSRAARSNDDARRGRALRGAKTGRAALCGRDCGGAGGVGRPSSARLAGGKIVDWRRWSWSERQPASCVVNQFQSSRARRVRRSALSTSWACTRRNGRADAGPGSD